MRKLNGLQLTLMSILLTTVSAVAHGWGGQPIKGSVTPATEKMLENCTPELAQLMRSRFGIKSPEEVAVKEPTGREHIEGLNRQENFTPPKTDGESWNMSFEGFQAITGQLHEVEYVLKGLITGAVAETFVMLDGDPGGAKTSSSRQVFAAAIRGVRYQLMKQELADIPKEELKTFVLQFHKLLADGVITGFTNVQDMLDKGKFTVNTDASLVSKRFIYCILDEIEKGNPATLTSLLSVLNERKAYLGAHVVHAILKAGAVTTNKTLAAWIQSFDKDRSAAEALADRLGIKVNVANQGSSAHEDFLMIEKKDVNDHLAADYKAGRKPRPPEAAYLDIGLMTQLARSVKIPDHVVDTLSAIIYDLDGQFTPKANDSRMEVHKGVKGAQEYFPANQFSIRSDINLIGVVKASFIVNQLLDGIPLDKIRTEMKIEDTVNLAAGAIFNGPGEIRRKSYSFKTLVGENISTFFADTVSKKADVNWQPATSRLLARIEGVNVAFNVDLAKGTITPIGKLSAKIRFADVKTVIAEIKKIDEEKKDDPTRLDFEEDGALDRLLSRETILPTARLEFQSLKEDRTAFLSVLNEKIKSPPPAISYKPVEDYTEALAVAARHTEEVLQNPNSTAEMREKASWESSALAYKQLRTYFRSVDHFIRAMFSSIASGSHLLVFGPPGAAKTMISRVILQAELKNISFAEQGHFTGKFMEDFYKRSPKQCELFFLQFHKLIPEGVITGFPVFNSLLKSGKMEYERSTSLANDRFVFAILDEVEKGNPAVLTSLLAVLNEREVFAGNEVIRAALRTAVLTSNKLPSEFIDTFSKDDRSTGLALYDRIINKAYVFNKFTSPEELAQFLKALERGHGFTTLEGLHLSGLQDMINRVEIGREFKRYGVNIWDAYMARQIEKQNASHEAKMDLAEENPYEYLRASTEGNRTKLDIFLKSWRANFILNQLLNGVRYEDVRYKVDFRDFTTLIQGMAFWGPYEVVATTDTQGEILTLEVNKDQLENLRNLQIVDDRNKYVQKSIIDEVTQYVEAANVAIGQAMLEFRGMIAKHPNLFPELFGSAKARQEWIDKHKAAATP